MENDNITRKKSTSVYWIFIVLFFSSTCVMAWLYYTELQKSKTLIVQVTDTTNEKEQITEDLNNLIGEYDQLKTNNDTLNAKLEKEKARIQELVEKIQNIKQANSYQIAQYKKELTTLREIMKSYIVQIDSLNTMNKTLTAENIMVKTEYQKARITNKELEDKNQDLSQKVTVASVIKVKELTAIPINSKSKEVNKASKVDKIKVCFTLEENEIAPAGLKDVFIRIARPDELVLATSENNLFSYQGNTIVYSAKREVDYQNQDASMCIYWKNKDELITGQYMVDIFADGNMIGSTTFILK
ncbi:MAG TPA: hypothetical protein DDX39_09315 [Bacteroidales bacterium]|nr:MAG: hypothetical protein A2W98_15220 [Bacteroidetes bacterium GWF2_33_38]OFY85906.1 MAG: hypothetical protein A2236_08690 [Bacteroidetes bacterium RIFOXYA2_FULL_33_7]HBF88828.1 hypothetical protein [Bacteroidales bacterium]